MKIHESGSSFIKVSVTCFPEFYEAVRKIPIRSLDDVSEDVLAKQYKEFLRRLGEITKDLKYEELVNLEVVPKMISCILLFTT